MSLADVVRDRGAALSPAERRVAEVAVNDPESVAFGTVADLAERAGTSPATVVRTANRLGYDGFPALQEEAQTELRRRLRPATERIRRTPDDDVLVKARTVETSNVETTLAGVAEDDLERAVDLLADPNREVRVLAADEAAGIAQQLATELAMVRTGVEPALGSAVGVARRLADLDAGDVVVVLDLPRYDRAVLEAARLAVARQATVIAVTDGPLSPLAGLAEVSFSVSADGAGPFDSYVGALALLNVLTAGVAGALRESATDRLDQIEAAWHDTDALTDG